MPDHPRNETGEPKAGAEARGAIAAFEQILDVMPDDVGALDALVRSCEMTGDRTRARDYLVRLVRVHLERRDLDAVAALTGDLHRLGEGDPECTTLLSDIKTHARAPEKTSAGASGTAGPADEIAIVESELSLAWRLHAADLLDQETYAAVANDVTESAVRGDGGTISALHALHVRRFPGLDAVIAFLAKDSRTPMIAATAFDVTKECQTLLPPDFMTRRGVVPLDFLGRAALIALLNPLDDNLRREVQQHAGCECHFFLTWPAHLDARLTGLLS